MRGLIRVLGGFMSFAAVVFGHKVATSATVISTKGSVVPNLSNLKVAVESTGASLNWGCIPMISGKSQPGYSAKQLNCSNMIDSAMVVEYTDKTVPQGGNVQSGYAAVLHQYCLGSQYNNPGYGNNRAWACFCNATGLCAPVKYLQHMGYGSGSGTYGTARYYTMEQWMAGVKETAGSGAGTGAGTGSVPTGSWGGYPSGATDWGRFYNQDEDGYIYLRYPVEVFNVAMSGCADGYYASTVSGTGTAQITVTAFMTTASLIDNSYADSNSFEAALGYGTPRYDYIGATSSSRSPVGSEWAVCSNSCPNASSTNTTLSGYSGTFYDDLKKYSVGYKCAADVSFTDGAGTFTMTGCVGSF
ncbi:MAG: hypothetical protein IIV74_02225 [Alphaproteobacteria bacterium]|nr:hypothetical protein [Alphaproteobacteria bacterium]